MPKSTSAKRQRRVQSRNKLQNAFVSEKPPLPTPPISHASSVVSDSEGLYVSEILLVDKEELAEFDFVREMSESDLEDDILRYEECLARAMKHEEYKKEVGDRLLARYYQSVTRQSLWRPEDYVLDVADLDFWAIHRRMEEDNPAGSYAHSSNSFETGSQNSETVPTSRSCSPISQLRRKGAKVDAEAALSKEAESHAEYRKLALEKLLN